MPSNKTLALAAAVACAVLLVADPASAQIGGGGGGGQLNTLLQWAINNVVRVAVSAGVIGIAITMLFFRFSLPVAGTVAAGGLLAANYTTITGFFGF